MSVYVDKTAIGYGRMIMCHGRRHSRGAARDGQPDRRGVARRWFQDPKTMKVSTPHYDIAKSKRALAIAAGAIECERNAFVDVVRRIRASEVWK